LRAAGVFKEITKLSIQRRIKNFISGDNWGMKKNNFFVKFLHYYKRCFTGIPERIEEIKDNSMDLFEPLLLLILHMVWLLIHVINIFFPILPFIYCLLSRYVDEKELEDMGVHNPDYCKPGYYGIWSIKKFKERIKMEKN